MTTDRETTTRYDGFAANIAIISALGLDPAKTVSVMIQMDGDGCVVKAVMLGDNGELDDVPDVISRFHLVPKQEDTP